MKTYYILRREPTDEEIRFGYGCEHYTQYPCDITKPGRHYISYNGHNWKVIGTIQKEE